MTPQRWQQVEAIFQEAAERSIAERPAFLAVACQGDTQLRHEVESLLSYEAAETVAQDPFDFVIKGAARSLVEKDNEDPFIGQMVGAYRITGLIKRGGMGAVYLAERADAQFQQQVAIKIIKRGMDTDHIRERFLQERQILASLDHPNIARLLDGGTTEDGLPYFVMEYVTGTALTDYCAARRLSLIERLRLFRQICAAVQYAHQKLIVHRDLKPSNILVNDVGIPKLLDFGIAKLLAPNHASPLTVTEQRMMTPDYASPEQVRGQAITTTTDVYSLGVVLYELLTGQRPHQFKTMSLSEIERAICETVPTRPSDAVSRETNPLGRLTRQLSGDLDNIILMALRKEPERRYQSVEQFSEDIRRHLEGLPVIARSDTFSYRASKFVRRHKIGIAALTFVIVTLLMGIIVTARSAQIARRERARAENRFAQVRKLSNTFLFDFHDKISKLAGATEAREMVVKTALEYLDSLAQEANGDADLQLELAQAYLRVAKVQGDTRQGNLGQTKAAQDSYRKAIALAEAIVPRDRTTKALTCLSQAYLDLGDAQVSDGDVAAGIATLQRGIPIAEQVYARGGTENSYMMPLIWACEYLGDAQLGSGDVTAALATYRRALQVNEERAKIFPEDAAQNGLALEYERIGDALAKQGDLAGTMDYYRRSLVIREDLVKRRPDHAAVRRNLTTAYNWMGNHLGHPEMINQGNPVAALEYFRKALAITEDLAAADAKDVLLQHDRVVGYSRLGLMLTNADPIQAISWLRKALALTTQALQEKPQDYWFLRNHIQALRRLATPLQRRGDYDGAFQSLQQAQDTIQKLTDMGKATPEVQSESRRVHLAFADWYLARRDYAQARNHYQQIQALTEKETNPKNLSHLWAQAEAYTGWARYYTALGEEKIKSVNERLSHWREARTWRQRALETWQQWNQNSKPNPFGAAQQEQAERALVQCVTTIGQLSSTASP